MTYIYICITIVRKGVLRFFQVFNTIINGEKESEIHTWIVEQKKGLSKDEKSKNIRLVCIYVMKNLRIGEKSASIDEKKKIFESL